jgi:hypothetical protein
MRNWKSDQRKRLHAEQSGLCFYCDAPIGWDPDSPGHPVLEHHRPKCRGGTHESVVLSCGWCDKTKGLIDGYHFKALVQSAMSSGLPEADARALVAQESAARNLELKSEHIDRLNRKKKA